MNYPPPAEIGDFLPLLTKRRFKILVDVVMFLLFLYLIGYRPGKGLLAHGVLGSTLLCLFVLHNILNAGWYRSLRKGRYPFVRKAFVVINLALLFDMVLMGISSVMISGMIFSFSPIRMTHAWRDVHVASTAWGFTLMTLHLGLHTNSALSKLEYKLKVKGQAVRLGYNVLYTALLCVGLACFGRSGLLQKMFLLDSWEGAFNNAAFYASHLMTVAGACLLVHFIFILKRKLTG